MLENLTGNMAENVAELERRFDRVDTFIMRKTVNEHNSELFYYLCYCGGMIDNQIVNEFIITPLVQSKSFDPKNPAAVIESVVFGHFPQVTSEFKELEEGIAGGDTIILLPGGKEAAILSTQGFNVRGIDEPEGERVLSGPREGFAEALIGNLSLLHRRFRSGDLKVELQPIGRRTGTRLALCYLDSLVKPELLQELKKRLEKIDIDGIFDSNSVAELIRDRKFSPFRTAGVTERPDIVAGKLLEGRIALFCDGSPAVITVPYLFWENFQSNEDYYVGYQYASFARLLRVIAFLITVITPALYVCVVSSHYEILPGGLILNMTSEFHLTPFPAAFETFFMLIVFDILKEGSMRMRAGGGMALGIVGALIIGQASVEASIVSPQIIIVAALAGITGLLIPRIEEAALAARYFLLAAASLFGIFGLSAGIVATVIHVQKLESIGVSLFGDAWSDLKDSLIRAPQWMMKRRPPSLSRNERRMADYRSGKGA